MNHVTDQIREDVRVAMLRQRVTQKELAERVGLSRQYISHLLTGHRGDLPEGWQKVLDGLDLELVVRPKERDYGRDYRILAVAILDSVAANPATNSEAVAAAVGDASGEAMRLVTELVHVGWLRGDETRNWVSRDAWSDLRITIPGLQARQRLEAPEVRAQYRDWARSVGRSITAGLAVEVLKRALLGDA